jgi:hypothetical protein
MLDVRCERLAEKIEKVLLSLYANTATFQLQIRERLIVDCYPAALH